MGRMRIGNKPPACQQCGKSVGPRRSTEQFAKWLARQFCGNDCANEAKRRKPPAVKP
jgi:hypothetical protein